MRKLFLVPTIVLTLTGCSNAFDQQQAEISGKTSVIDENLVKSSADMMPGALTKDEADVYRADLSVAQKLKLADELAMKMPRDGMNQMKTMFSDLELVSEIDGDSVKNIMKMGTETWFYSKSADITIVACNETNGPIHVFKGKDPSDKDIYDAVKSFSMMEDQVGEVNDVGTELLADPQYVNYSDSLYESLLGKKAFAIFFHANWCPTCRQMEKDITSNLGSFPKGSIILKADFDTQTALEQKYEVVAQSFIVVIDANGEVVSKLWGPNSDTLKASIQKSL